MVVRLARCFAENVMHECGLDKFAALVRENDQQPGHDRSCCVDSYCSADICMAAAWDEVLPGVNCNTTEHRRAWRAAIRCATLNSFFQGVLCG